MINQSSIKPVKIGPLKLSYYTVLLVQRVFHPYRQFPVSIVMFAVSYSVLGSVFIGGTVAEPSQLEHPSNAYTTSGSQVHV